MSIYLYDEAITAKFKSWTEQTDLHVYSPDDTQRLFEIQADEHNDKPIELPLICLRRNPTYTLVVPNRETLAYDGFTPQANYDKTLQINAIPIILSYQLDVYTRYLKEGDEYMRNLIFNITNFPSVTVHMTYNGYEFSHDSAIEMSPEIEDNSNVSERLIQGQFTRFTMTLNVNDAYLWDIRYRDNYHIIDTEITD